MRETEGQRTKKLDQIDSGGLLTTKCSELRTEKQNYSACEFLASVSFFLSILLSSFMSSCPSSLLSTFLSRDKNVHASRKIVHCPLKLPLA